MFKIFSIATLVYSECTIALVNFRKSISVNSEKKAYKLLDQNWGKNDPFWEQKEFV